MAKGKFQPFEKGKKDVADKGKGKEAPLKPMKKGK